MGVYYEASVAWGFLLPVPEGEDPDDVYDIPPGFDVTVGGDEIDDDIRWVLHPEGAKQIILNSRNEDGLGVYPVDRVYRPTWEDNSALLDFTDRYNLPGRFGWFAISSVG